MYRYLVEALVAQEQLDDAGKLVAFAARNLPEEDAGVLLSLVSVVARSITIPPNQTQLQEPLAGPDAASGSTPVPQAPSDTRERLARAMSLAIADLNRGDLRPKPQHFSEWNFQDTDVEQDDEPPLLGRSHGLLVGSLVVLVSAMLGAAWALART